MVRTRSGDQETNLWEIEYLQLWEKEEHRQRTLMRTVGAQLGIASRWEVDTNFKPYSLGKDLCSTALAYSELGAIPKSDSLLPLGQSVCPYCRSSGPEGLHKVCVLKFLQGPSFGGQGRTTYVVHCENMSDLPTLYISWYFLHRDTNTASTMTPLSLETFQRSIFFSSPILSTHISSVLCLWHRLWEK